MLMIDSDIDLMLKISNNTFYDQETNSINIGIRIISLLEKQCYLESLYSYKAKKYEDGDDRLSFEPFRNGRCDHGGKCWVVKFKGIDVSDIC